MDTGLERSARPYTWADIAWPRRAFWPPAAAVPQPIASHTQRRHGRGPSSLAARRGTYQPLPQRRASSHGSRARSQRGMCQPLCSLCAPAALPLSIARCSAAPIPQPHPEPPRSRNAAARAPGSTVMEGSPLRRRARTACALQGRGAHQAIAGGISTASMGLLRASRPCSDSTQRTRARR
ncbi:hypothetical protein BU26DRAFT_240671 [Trematosphaeria pertusa]|uniref:Uncharacterized protein n=1 Tax=Trematosphaeria pertusa TaxID=390896 RepID=A0A6A6IN19_9PLEO|nr:uncharacterized protein BU26DRAFT_240671 [Trematosphaeria pertusa]KAF2251637.1 hypothetical protein BU26DRAFT_240671 [Trematosphaeria pertusa]